MLLALPARHSVQAPGYKSVLPTLRLSVASCCNLHDASGRFTFRADQLLTSGAGYGFAVTKGSTASADFDVTKKEFIGQNDPISKRSTAIQYSNSTLL
jgi:hypothetical protein